MSFPGPPEIHYHEAGPSVSRTETLEDDEPFPQVPRGYENGEVSGSGSEEEEEPPPIPPRGKSLSPETKSNAMMTATGKGLINGSADHFLGGGRGDGVSLSPLLNENGSAAVSMVASVSEGGEETPPPIPGKLHAKELESGGEMEADEEALLSELNELKNLLSEHERQTAAVVPPGNKMERAGAPPASQDTEM